ncbi:Protein of unknown function [Gryllus bimaculatus]|nr:Protein of unknown function [Gryllus bimaculatus]
MYYLFSIIIIIIICFASSHVCEDLSPAEWRDPELTYRRVVGFSRPRYLPSLPTSLPVRGSRVHVSVSVCKRG